MNAQATPVAEKAAAKTTKLAGPILARLMGNPVPAKPAAADPSLNDEERREAREAAADATAEIDDTDPLGANSTDGLAALAAKQGQPRKAKTENKQAQAEMDALFDEVTDKTDQAAGRASDAEKAGHELIRLMATYRDASGDEREALKGKALAQGVTALEALDFAMARLKGLRVAHQSRLVDGFGFASQHVTQCIKERKEPQQLVLAAWADTRKAVDGLHTVLQQQGVARKGDEPKAKKSRKGK